MKSTLITSMIIASMTLPLSGFEEKALPDRECPPFASGLDDTEKEIDHGITCFEVNNYGEAYKWFDSATQNDSSGEALFYLGLMYANGNGVAQNHRKATRLYKEAAEKKLPEAQYNYGIRLLEGIGTRINAGRGAHYIYLAAQQGFLIAMHQFGILLLRGRGTHINYMQAYAWLSAASRNGYKTEQNGRYIRYLATVLSSSELLLTQSIADALVSLGRSM